MTSGTPKKLDLQTEVKFYLQKNGPTTAKLLCQIFKLSQPSLSRIITVLKEQLVIIGKARTTAYALRRKIENFSQPVPIYEIFEEGSSEQFGVLYAIEPRGFYFENLSLNSKTSAISPDLPYFLNDLRPGGFLGRLIPTQNKDLNIPEDIRLWSAEQTLKYLSERSWNNVGNLIVGEKSFKLYLENCQSPTHAVENKNKRKQYPLYANNVLSFGDAGSSAGGEQPKFTTILKPSQEYVMVKFSPPTNTEIGKRIADLLICEHIALQVLNKNSHTVADSEILIYENRVFLELKRFDRIPPFGRRGLISLGSLDAEFTGVLSSWSKTSAELIKKKILPKNMMEKIRFRELFGELIANNDMHLYNLSFFTKGQNILDLSPVYDMSPMLFMPKHNQITLHIFNPKLPTPEDQKIWDTVYTAAKEFWDEILKEKRISSAFKEIAKECRNKLKELENIARLLPQK